MCSKPKIPDPAPPEPPIAPIAAPQGLASPEGTKRRPSGSLAALRIGNKTGEM